MAAILRFYMRALHTHPWKTQLFTTGFLMGSSDLIAQTVFEHRKLTEVEIPRVARFAVLGTCFVGPTLRVWYLVLERTFGAIGRTIGLKKMLCDQFMFSPCFIGCFLVVLVVLQLSLGPTFMFSPCFIGCFLVVLGTLQFQPWQNIKSRVKQEYFTILKTNYMLWPGAQLITFYLIPLHMRVVFVSFIALLWNTYLAYQANKSYK